MKKVAILLALVSFSCGSPSQKPITIKGSDTMVLIGQRWAEKYMQTYPKEVIQVNGGGSGTGFAALLNGTTDICQSSRPIKEAEVRSIKEKFHAEVLEVPVARDGIAIYVHPSNPIQSISLSDLEGIYTGVVTNWKMLGGSDRPIIVYGRENSSGTYEFFKEHVLNKKDFAASVQALPGTSAIVSSVGKDENSIGYGGVAYMKGVKIVPVKVGGDTILPSSETVSNLSYPISRDLFFYLVGSPSEREQKFIDFVLSEAGQGLSVSEGYFRGKGMVK